MRGPDIHDPHRPAVDPVTGQTVASHPVGGHPVGGHPVGGHPVGGHTVASPAVDTRTVEQIRQDAYKAGVADERARHKRNPLLTILIALLAVLGLVLVVLYFVNGRSFSGAGARLDQAASQAGEQVQSGAREAADEAGEGLQDVGRNIEQRGEAPPSAYGDAVQSAPQPGAASTGPAPVTTGAPAQ